VGASTFAAGIAAFFLLTLGALSASAGSFEAREAARNSNCTPKKIEIVRQSIGSEGRTIYRVSCTLPKTDDSKAATADALLVQCDGMLCNVLRPVSADDKK
jgi:hypothetical protein